MVAHPRPAAPKIPPCTPNEFFAKQLPITPPPEDILGHIAWQLPLIWAPAASHTPSRSPSKAHRLAAIWRKPAKKRTTQIALRRARRGGSIIRGQQSFPRHPLRPFRPPRLSLRKSPGPGRRGNSHTSQISHTTICPVACSKAPWRVARGNFARRHTLTRSTS